MRMDLHVRVAAQGRSRLGARVALLASLLAIAPVACGGGDDDGAGAESGAGAKAGKGGEAPVLALEDAGAGRGKHSSCSSTPATRRLPMPRWTCP
jgi:hypothetical protein